MHSTACSVTATVSNALPGVVTYNTTITTKSSISANAGGLINSNIWGSGAVVGQILSFDVIYSFGNASVGDEYNLQPCGNLDFDASTFQLINSRVVSSVIPGIDAGVSDSLYFIAGLKNGSGNLVTMRYYFQVMRSNQTGTYCRPYASQTSGIPVKYTGNFDIVVLSPAPPPGSFPFNISLVPSRISAMPCDTVNYRVVVRNTSIYESSYDIIKVTLLSYMSYIGLLPGSQVTLSKLMAYPAFGATGSIRWNGGVASSVFPYKEFYIPDNDSLILLFNAKVSCAVPLNTTSKAKAIAYAGSDSSNLVTKSICLNCPTLPVSGFTVTARMNDSKAYIDWKTEAEFNSSYFVVERSTDNLNYTNAGTVAAAGNSNTRHDYSFTDNLSSVFQNDIFYYRIRQVDIDARNKVSNIVVVKMNKKIGMQAWPNPFTSYITVNVTTEQATDLTIHLKDLAGRTIQTQQQQAQRGVTQVTINNLDNLSSGVYIFDIVEEMQGNKTQLKFIKG